MAQAAATQLVGTTNTQLHAPGCYAPGRDTAAENPSEPWEESWEANDEEAGEEREDV